MTGIVLVGVGVIVQRAQHVLVGRRRGAHGAGTWGLPGGRLEFQETPAQCAAREVREETGLDVHIVGEGPFTNDVFAADGQHFLTVFMLAVSPAGEPRLMEPHKCDEWRWVRWSELPMPVFQPLASLLAAGYAPPGAR